MKINEIFYSLQGEGFHTGTAATFVRFSGCNLRCPFCDTDYKSSIELTEEQIIDIVSKNESNLVVFTGGEPSLQLTISLVLKMQEKGKYVAIETNGTHSLPPQIDWITLSPKEPFVGDKGKIVLNKVDEIKIVHNGDIPTLNKMMGIVEKVQAKYYFIQPCDTGNKLENQKIINECVNIIKSNPKWRMSLQTQKILKVR